MNISRQILVAGVLAIAGAASAQFTTTFVGPVNSDGPKGSANNGVLTNVAPETALYGQYRLRGRLTEVNTGTFASEARWEIRNTTKGSFIDFQATTVGNFTGFLDIDVTANVLAWVSAGDNFRFEAFESFNDSGIDAHWTNGSHEFSGTPTIIDLGNYNVGTSFVFDTLGSGFDTELALFSEDGFKIADDDDGAGGLLSRIDAGVLGMGCYYLVAGGYNSLFNNYFAVPGTATGNLNVQLNGATVSSGTLGAREFRVHKLCVVPEPASMAALGLGALVLIRRRRNVSK